MAASRLVLVVLALASLSVAGCQVEPERPGPVGSYAILIDASSSGSRIHLFQVRQQDEGEVPWVRAAPFPREPGEEAWQTVVDGGLSDHEDDPSAAGESLAPLMDFATGKLAALGVDAAGVSLHLKATAGMRLVHEPARSAIMADVSQFLAAAPFDFQGAEIISGDQEGLYGWITVNYILGLLGGGPFPTVGALDLGGASTQITFLPVDFPELDAQEVELGGTTYRVYTHSYLGLGQDQARATVASADCWPRGYTVEGGGANGFARDTTGTGDFDACRQSIRETFSAPCDGSTCSMMGEYQPPIYGDFFGFSVFGYAASFFELGQNLSLETLAARGSEFCGRDWQQTLALYPDQADSKYLPRYCYGAAHIVTLLVDGYGFAPDTRRIVTPSRVQGVEVSWVLGALINELD